MEKLVLFILGINIMGIILTAPWNKVLLVIFWVIFVIWVYRMKE